MRAFRIEEIPSPDDAQLLPGEAFWTRILQLPPGLSPDESAGAADLSIDTSSPFPPDRRVSGSYPLNPERTRLLLYAASRGRLERLGTPLDDSARAVLPAFVPALALALATDQDLLIDAVSSSGFILIRENGLPRVLTLPPTWDPRTRATFLQSEVCPPPPSDAAGLDLHFTADPSGTWTADFVPSNGNDPDEPFPAIVIPAETQPHADLRGPAAIALLRRTERSRRRLRRITRGLAATLVLTGILQLLMYPFNGYVETLRTDLRDITAEVEAMDTRRELVLRLEKLSEGSSPPLEWIAIANLSRPETIEWDEALVTANGFITIEGRAPDIATVNQYAAQLRANPVFTEVVSEATAREGRIAFDLRLRFAP